MSGSEGGGWKAKLNAFLAGGAGGACLVVVGQPFDTIKVRLQTMPESGGKPLYSGTMDCVLKTVRKEGPTALYKGMAAPLGGVIPTFAACFLGYNYGKDIFCDKDAFTEMKLGQIGLAGSTSALFTTPILAPGERIKCVLQTQGMGGAAAKYKGPVDVVKGLYHEAGVRSVCRGFPLTLARDGIGSFFYFGSYEYLKSRLSRNGKEPGAVALVAAGGFAGVCNWGLAIPVDTVKSRYQVAPEGQYSSGRAVAQEIIKKEGGLIKTVRTMYRGFAVIMMRAFPANAACFVGYEYTAKGLAKIGLK